MKRHIMTFSEWFNYGGRFKEYREDIDDPVLNFIKVCDGNLPNLRELGYVWDAVYFYKGGSDLAGLFVRAMALPWNLYKIERYFTSYGLMAMEPYGPWFVERAERMMEQYPQYSVPFDDLPVVYRVASFVQSHARPTKQITGHGYTGGLRHILKKFIKGFYGQRKHTTLACLLAGLWIDDLKAESPNVNLLPRDRSMWAEIYEVF